MKKISIVLLMVLVAGFAFASFTGNASIAFGYDLDSTDWGFKNASSTTYKFTFEIDSSKGESKGEGTVYAEIAGTASAKITESNAAASAANIAVSAKISKANIVWVYTEENPIVFGILNAGSGATFAQHFTIKSNNPIENTIKNLTATAPGFTVTHYGWTLGFGAQGNVDAEKYTIFASIKTKEFKFAEDALSLQASAFTSLTDASTLVAGGLKAGYKADKLTANAAFDASFQKAAAADEGTFLFEAEADATYDFVTVSVYATPGAATTQAALYAGDDAEALRLDAEVAAAKEFGEETKVKVTAAVGTQNALIEAISLYAKAGASTTIDAFTIAANAQYDFNFLEGAAQKSDLTADASVKYAAEKFTATAKITAKFDLTAEDALTSLAPELTVESTKLISNATLAFTWKGADFAVEDKLGKLEAKCTVSFK